MSDFTENEKIAIQRYQSGEPAYVSTFIDEETLTYGYGHLSSMGSWEFEVPHSELTKGESKAVAELMSRHFPETYGSITKNKG